MKIKFEGAKELNAKLRQMAAQSPYEIAQFMSMEAEKVKGRAKLLTPVGKTGRLRRDWSSNVNGATAEIFNNVEYAPYVEFGHRVKIHGKFTGRVVPGAHMLRDAIESSAASFQQDAAQIMARIFR